MAKNRLPMDFQVQGEAKLGRLDRHGIVEALATDAVASQGRDMATGPVDAADRVISGIGDINRRIVGNQALRVVELRGAACRLEAGFAAP